MKRNILIAIVIVLVLVLVGIILKTKVFSGPTLAALKISSDPKATVFVDGTQMGVTPFFDDKIKVGEHIVKLVPDSSNGDLGSLEKKVNLVSTALTYIDYNFKSKQSETFGQILSLEKITSRDKAALSVISVPDQAVVKINNDPKGFTPVMLEDLDPGSYQITVSSPGYDEKTIAAVNLIAGYKIKIEVKLAQKIEGFEEASSAGQSLGVGDSVPDSTNDSPTPTEKVTSTPTPSPTGTKSKLTPTPTSISSDSSSDSVSKPYVIVKDTPTGFLRVRSTPDSSSTDNEIGRANPGDKLPYLGEQQSGWYKVTYKNQTGWVSGTYVNLVK